MKHQTFKEFPMKNILFYLMSAGMTMLVLSCGGAYNLISSDADNSIDFSKYKTFAWLPDKADTSNSPYNNDIIRNNIRNYYGLCMSDRGYSLDLENPDLLLELVITNAEKERLVNSYQSPYPSSYYYRPYYYGSTYYSPYRSNYFYSGFGHQSFNYTYPRTITTTKEQYVEGAITLNFIDVTSKQLVWTGTAKGDIYDASFISSSLHPAVHAIVEQYPIKSLVKRTHKIR